MTRKEIERILEYCTKATRGPWTRSRTKPKFITSDETGAPKDICQLPGESHNEDWDNYHFLTKARTDLPRLAKHYLRLRDYLKTKTRLLEQERGKKQWLLLKKRNKQIQLERGRQRWLQLQKENEQLKLEIADKEKQIEETSGLMELERAKNQMELEKLRSDKQQELEKAQNKLKLLGRGKTEDAAGFCDGLLNKLRNLETTFNSSGQFWQYEQDGTAAKSKEEADNKPDVVLSNDELLGELNDIEAALRPKRKARQRPKSKSDDPAEVAREFIEPTNTRTRPSSKSKAR
jgi:hypothetical protein